MAVISDKGKETPRFLVGRSAELATLARHAEGARREGARAVLVRGPAGIGRTSLLAAFADRSAAAGGAVRYCAGSEQAEDGRRVLGRLLGQDPHALPEPAATLPGTPAAHAAYAFHRRFHRHLAGLLAAGPLTLVVDDAQWCDEASLRSVDFVLRRATALPLLVLFAQRTECHGPGTDMLAEFLAQGRCATLDLGPLTRADTARMAVRTLGRPADESFLRHCAEISGGNPARLVRLLTGVSAAGLGPDAAGTRHLRRTGDAVLAESVTAHLAGCPGPERAVAQALAVLGRSCSDPLAALSGVTGRRLTEALDALRRNGVVDGPPEDTAGGPTGGVVRPAAGHPVVTMRDAVRDAVLAGLPAARLESLRARAARVLNDAGRPAADVADQLLLLKELAEPWMLAVLRDAAAEAPDRDTSRAAIRYLRRALDADLTGTQRQVVRIELARASAPVAPATALCHLRQALADATTPGERAPIAVEYGMTALGTRDAPDAVRVLGEALTALQPEPGTDPADTELRTSVAATLLVTAVNEKAALAGVQERAAAWPVPPGDSPAERRLLSGMGVLAALDGRPARQAVALARRALKVEEPAPVGWWVFGASLVLGIADETDEALTGLGRVLSSSWDRYEPGLHMAALSGRSVVRHSIGDVGGAAVDARAAVDLAETVRGPSSPLPYIALGSALLSQGQLERAETALAHGGRRGVDRRIWEWHHHLYTLGRVRRERGDLDGALELWQRCGRSLEEAGVTNPVLAPWWLPTASVLVQLGRRSEAAAVAEGAQERVRRWGTPRGIGLGLLAAGVVADGRARLDLLAEAVDALAASPARLEQAKAQYQLGYELLRHEDTRGARRHLRGAIELATRCGYHILGGLARKLLVAAGGRMPQLAASPVDSLTDSERRVADLARRGVSNKEIADALFVTPRTVEMHLTNVYRKLDVRGRAELPRSLGAPGPLSPRPPERVGPPAGAHAPGR
ncbi:helix-turn-helix transcriptional regulator [Streptomyces eurocidicus]|uniref:DNA-binding CsgD family transcriptional regulator n=1 Tax=Streptomyces eurocidicus TaxID=66423 RepID=A0A7W8BEH9_STREU|nr:AAA family ATPase [Streptomyces eurocidicus]MBB5121915.1 DNA-binding CsgD family transcriptional regulator [Streptomyces eurocidicus]MBF6051572.1 AAA family ATPase [Streptomyces eurocidicus]